MRPAVIASLTILCATLVAACRPAGAPPAPAAPEAAPASPVQATVPASDGVSIAYTVSGAGEPTIVLVHCWSCDRSFWNGTVADLSRDHRVVAVDLPGHGASGRDRDLYSIQGYGEDVATLVNALALDRVVIVGHSMGGPVAVEAARRIPEKTLLVVGVDTLHDVTEKEDPAQWDELLGDLERDFSRACPAFVGTMFPKQADPKLVAGVRGRMCAADPRIAVAVLRSVRDYDEAAGLAALRCPVRLVQGSLFPTNVATGRKVHADLEATVVPETGHFPFLEKPEAFGVALRQSLGAVPRP